MSDFNKFNQFARDVLEGRHDFSADDYRVALTDTQPTQANALLADITQIAPGNGYSAGGSLTVVETSIDAGTAKVSGENVIFTAAGGDIGPLRYAVLYNDTKPGKPLVAWWDYGVSITLKDTENLTVRLDDNDGIFTLS